MKQTILEIHVLSCANPAGAIREQFHRLLERVRQVRHVASGEPSKHQAALSMSRSAALPSLGRETFRYQPGLRAGIPLRNHQCPQPASAATTYSSVAARCGPNTLFCSVQEIPHRTAKAQPIVHSWGRAVSCETWPPQSCTSSFDCVLGMEWQRSL